MPFQKFCQEHVNKKTGMKSCLELVVINGINAVISSWVSKYYNITSCDVIILLFITNNQTINFYRLWPNFRATLKIHKNPILIRITESAQTLHLMTGSHS